MILYVVVILVLAISFFLSARYLYSSVTKNEVSTNFKASLIFMLFVPIVSFGLYLYLGDHHGYNQRIIFEENAKLYDAELARLSDSKQSLMDTITNIQARQKNSPEDIYGWFILGKLYYAAREPALANKVYETALALAPGDDKILKAYTESLYASGEKPKRRIQILEDLTARNKRDYTSRNLLALSYFEVENYQAAIDIWSELRDKASDNQKVQLALTHLIDKAKSKQRTSPALAFKVTVDVSPLLLKTLKSNNTVFLFVKSKTQTMPLWVKRIDVTQFPQSVTLNASNAMQGVKDLTKLKEVIVGARVSKSGTATRQTGDIGKETAISLQGAKSYDVKLILDEVY